MRINYLVTYNLVFLKILNNIFCCNKYSDIGFKITCSCLKEIDIIIKLCYYKKILIINTEEAKNERKNKRIYY